MNDIGDRTSYRAAARSRVSRAWATAREREDGQALVLVLIVVLLLVLIAPVVVSQVTNEDTNVAQGASFEAALSAAEAGVQQYRNFLDVESDYWKYNYQTGNTDGDTALPVNGWTTVDTGSGGSPPEAFHYIPNTSELAGKATVILTVTGRAGNAGHYVYRTVQTDLEAQGILSNAYFSQYEVLDWQQDPATVVVTPWTQVGAGKAKSGTPTDYSISQAPQVVAGQTFYQSVCQYDTYQQNTFIDGLTGTNAIGNPYVGGNYAAAAPYYGAFRGNEPNSTTNNSNVFTYTYPSVTNGGTTTWQVATVTDPCGGIFNFVTGENFTGPVYSNDQFWICGNPSFSDGLTSGVPKGFAYAYKQWPTQDSSEPSGTNGWIDNLELNWDNSCGGNGKSNPNFNGGVATPGGDSNLPPVNGLLQQVAGKSGCTYTGPTMIQFLSDGTYDVWSPLTTSPGTGCGTFDSTGYATSPVTIPSTGLVIYVQNEPSTSTPPTNAGLNAYISAGALPTGASCLDPWKPYVPVTGTVPCPEAYEGDVVVSGEVKGQVTVGAQDNIIVGRDLTYACADGGGVSAQQSTTYSLSAAGSTCVTETDPDVIGLVANGDVVEDKPGVETSTLPPSNDNIGTTQTEPYEWPAVTTYSGYGICDEPDQDEDGTQAPGSESQFYAYNVPDCEMSSPTIDAAIVALFGSFADEDWDIPDCDNGNACKPNGDAWLQGTDVSYFRGPFGEGGSSGLDKEFTYDARLRYLTPPSMIDITNLVWSPSSFVNCGTVDDEAWTPALKPLPNVCPGLDWLNS